MPQAVYKLIHFFGLFGMVTLLAGAAMHALVGHTRAERPFGRGFAIAHGIGAFLVLLGGFGMLARLGIAQQGLPGWVYAKLVLWLALSAALILPYRGRALALSVIVGIPLLTVLGAAIALYKPF
jgi:hypothetical protein